MAITLITPHQRPNSGGVYVIQQLARLASALTEVHLVVAKGEPAPVAGVQVHGPEALARRELPESDALLIPADLDDAEPLFGLAPDRGAPMLLFQGYGAPDDPVVTGNLDLARHAVCLSTWLVDTATGAGCTTTLVRHGLDRQVFSPGASTEERGPVVSMMTHPSEAKGTADGLQALRLAAGELPELEVRLFGKADPHFENATFLAAPNQLSQVAELLRSSAVFVCPSWEEGFGLPGIEAISSGAALATTDTKGSRDYAFHARTALVSPPHDPEALARSVVDLIRDTELRRRLIDAGRRHIDDVYPDWERAAERFVVAIDDAALAVRATGHHAEPPAIRDDDQLDPIAAQPLRRDARRTRLMLREAETERNELEAELGRRLQESSDARRRSRELQLELERERDQHQQTELELAALRRRAAPLMASLAEADEHVAASAATVKRAERSLAATRRKLRAAERSLEDQGQRLTTARATRDRLGAELHEVRAALPSELAAAQAEAKAAQRSETSIRRELAQLRSELELGDGQRHRLQAALARARADAQVAEAERAAFERQTAALSALLERAGATTNGQPVAAETVRPTEAVALAAVHRLPSAADTWPALAASERDGQATFLGEYRELVSQLSADGGGRDPLALPLPADLRGALTPVGAGQGSGVPSVDVIVCVHDALEHVRLCLWSLLHKTGRGFGLVVVNDGSDEATTAFLAELAEAVPALTLIHNDDPPHGYTIAANLGLRASTADYVVMLNSDTVVSYGWLERIVAHGERHEHVGILGPLSNSASHQSVPERRSQGAWATNPLPGWLTADGMALILRQATPRTATRLPFINGFCFVIKRAVIAAIGEFDEQRFATGYAEENDYAQRARAAGFELAVVDDAYVYHAKSRSYGTAGRNEVSKRAYQTFLDKHGREEIDRLVKGMEADTTLDPVRTAVAETISSPQATEAALAQNGEENLSVVFVLPGLGDGGSGGSHSVYQEVHGLRRLGVPARIALHERAWERALEAYPDAEAVFQTYRDANDLVERAADANVIVATHFKSVATVAAVRAQRDDFLAAYYVQDYEPMFKFADAADNAEAARSYTAISGALLFAKTHWLCNVVSRRHGVFVAKVEPSIDDQLYRPNGATVGSGPVRIAAMVRPRTPRRQPYSTTAVLERVLDRLPGAVEVTTFGCRPAELAKITESRSIRAAHRGLLKRQEVARLLGSTDVFLDMSTYQAFGRTALEAMACGATAIVPRLGGVWDFARDGENLLAVDTMDRDAAFDAVAALVDDRQRLAQLKSAARETASRYSILRAALSEYIVLRDAHHGRPG